MLGRIVLRQDIERLVDALYSLGEPWRSRFLDLVANRATGGAWRGRQPAREDLLIWFGTDLRLYREVALLLQTWTRTVSER